MQAEPIGWASQALRGILRLLAKQVGFVLDIIPTGRYKLNVSTELLAGRPMAAARRKLLEAALSVIRAKGYEATTVDDLCAEAGVAKGSFFHHFKTKEALGIAAAEYWSEVTSALFEAAPYHR